MNFDDQIQRYFGTPNLDEVSEPALMAGVEHMRVDLGLETDSDRRFALWSLLYMLGAAPDIGVTFEDEEDREAARDLMDMLDEEDEEG